MSVKTFNRADYRRAMYWLAKPLRESTTTIQGRKRKVYTVRPVDSEMRAWINEQDIERARTLAQERNGLL